MKQNKMSLLLIDLQNDFLSQGGILSEVLKEQVESTGLIEKINNLTKSARKNNIKVVHAPIAFSKNHAELGGNPYGIAKIVKDNGAFKENEVGSNLASSINVEKEDLILPFKKSISVFKTTNLNEELRINEIDTLVVAGLLTDACMLATVIEAYDLGYTVITVTNATAATSQKSKEDTIRNIFPLFSIPMTDAEVVKLFDK